MTTQADPETSGPVSSAERRSALPDGDLIMWEVDFIRHRVVCSQRAGELWGLVRGSPEEFLDRIHPADRRWADEPAAITLIRINEAGLTYRVRGADGRYRPIFSRGEIFRGTDGRPERMLGCCFEVPGPPAPAGASAVGGDTADRLQLALRAASAGTWDYDVDSGIALWSDQCLALHGAPPATDSLTYDQWLALVHPDDRHRTQATLQAVLQKGGELTLEYRVQHPSHGVRWLLSLGQSVTDDRGRTRRLSGIVLDINERRQVEERLRQSAKMEAIGQLAGGLAHDFNNQLHALSGLLDFVARDPGLSDPSKNDLVEIQNTTERMASLTRQLLAFSRQQVLIPETIDLNQAVLETKPMLQRLVGANFELKLELFARPSWVKVDRSQLLQVLMNLVINARDAMPEGGQAVLKTGIREVRGRELDRLARGPVLPGSYAELMVQDSGRGIAPEDLTRIFEAFFTTKPVGEGTGLGLATVDGILSQSKGHIWAESEAGQGARFVVLLPLTAPPKEATPAVPPPPARTGPRARLMVVDDEEMVREVIVRTLTNHGYEVYQAVHGEDALAQLEAIRPPVDLVVSDVVMPVMGGAELALKLAELYPGLPIVWMSGYPRETVIGGGRLGEDQPFLQKPVPPALLLDTVARSVKAG